jgi:hypothetical protein
MEELPKFLSMNDKFIWENPNALDSDFCNQVIHKFERDIRKVEGTTLGGINTKTKKSTDLHITSFSDWGEYDKIFYESLNVNLEKYKQYIHDNVYPNILDLQLTDYGYQIQRTVGGDGFYNWHHDYYYDQNLGSRFLTFIWYLNDVNGDGETEFISGDIIKPETGKIIFFPATWTYYHRGKTPKTGLVKYICTGWLYHKTN